MQAVPHHGFGDKRQALVEHGQGLDAGSAFHVGAEGGEQEAGLARKPPLALAQAGEAQGLSPDLALQLAKATVAGAGALAEASDESPAQLRINVTSPNGTTQAALEVLMDKDRGFPKLVAEAVDRATKRSVELSRG